MAGLKKMNKTGIQDEDMSKIYEFFNKNKNLIFAVIVIVALGIVGYNYYESNVVKQEKLAAEALFTLKNEYADKKYDEVITKGLEQSKEFSSNKEAGNILLYVAKAYIQTDQKEFALKTLQECVKNYGSNDLIGYNCNYIMGGLYIDQWLEKKDNSLALLAASLYEKAGNSNNKIFKETCTFLAADSYFKAGDNDKAKTLIKPLFDKGTKLEYKLRNKVKELYNKVK